jgi:hypothetical protein
MHFKSFVSFMVALMVAEGLIALVLSHGMNGQYFKSSKNNGEAIAKLRTDKPRTATVIGICYVSILVEFCLVVIVKFWS